MPLPNGSPFTFSHHFSCTDVQRFPGGSGGEFVTIWMRMVFWQTVWGGGVFGYLRIWLVSKSAQHFEKDASGASGQACLSKSTYASFLSYIRRMFWNQANQYRQLLLPLLPTSFCKTPCSRHSFRKRIPHRQAEVDKRLSRKRKLVRNLNKK